MTKQHTQQIDSDPVIDQRPEMSRLSALHFAHRCLGRYLESRTNPGDAADNAPADPATEAVVQAFGDSRWFGTWLMKLGADVHTDALDVRAPVMRWRVRAAAVAAPTGCEGTT